jgi:hypothetical protein
MTAKEEELSRRMAILKIFPKCDGCGEYGTDKCGYKGTQPHHGRCK